MGTMKQFEEIDIEVLRKYDKPGPRYTSYPTAPVFTSEFGPKEFEEEIIRTNQVDGKADLSLYFHLPFCDTLCYFCGCTMIVTHSRQRIKEYIEYLKREIDIACRHIASDRKVTQIHWGGGTPSYLDPDEIRDLAGYINERFRFDTNVEAGVEIDPRGLTFEHMKAFRESGFNRVSMGVQDFNPKVQEAVNRIQSEDITRQAIDWCRQLGFKSINLDLIYGLPFQTVKSFEETIDKILQIAPDRIAIFNFAYVPWLKKHQKLIHPEDLPTPDTKLKILKMTIEKLTDAGYWYIGMDHFSKPDDELAIAQKTKTLYRNFQGYSTKAGCDLYAFGMSAISQFKDIYAQNVKELPAYYKAIDSGRFATHIGYRMTEDDHVRRYTIMHLMCDMELSKSDVESRYLSALGTTFDEYFAEALEKLGEFVAEGLVTKTYDRIIVNSMGRLIVRNIAMCFDAYLEKMMKEKPIFSRTV